MINNLDENSFIHCVKFLNMEEIIIVSKINCCYNNLIKKYYNFLIKKLVNNLIKCEDENNITLIDCFDYTFKDEKFENTNLYYCDKCKTHNQAIKKHYIWKLPENLIIVFKRFNGLDKDNTHITFDINNLNLSKYTYNDNTINYNLYSTINHFGNILGGHYINISKRDNKWYIFDDDKRQDLNNTELFYTNTYILFYK